MIETIIADGTTIPPVMIVQGKRYIENWYLEKLEKGVRVVLSDSRYTNKEILLILLNHIILYTEAGINKPLKVLLIDRHGSHIDPDFIIKATASNIHPYPFPSHLTYVLQPLDVGVFQPYKHWHKKAVQHAMRNLDLDYNIASFMQDLTEIQAETFKKSTIHHAFQKAGIWPISCKVAIAKMKIYAPLEALIELPTLPRTPTRFQHAEYGLLHWKEKVLEKLSSPSRKSFDSWACRTEKLLVGGELTVLQHNALATKVQNQQKAKYRNRNVLQKNGVLTAEDAWAKKAADTAKRQAILDKRRATLI
jgi:DDE superfamily endonuclease